MGSLLSPALAEFLGVERMARPTVVKKLWEYIKAHNLQVLACWVGRCMLCGRPDTSKPRPCAAAACM